MLLTVQGSGYRYITYFLDAWKTKQPIEAAPLRCMTTADCFFVPLCGLVVAHVKPQIQRLTDLVCFRRRDKLLILRGRWIEDNIPSLKVEDYTLWDGRWRDGALVILRQSQFLFKLKDIPLSLFQQRPMKGQISIRQ